MEVTDHPLQQDPRRPLGWLGLFASVTTLVCCALPILLVSLGLGATVAAIFEAVPALAVLGENKAWTLAVAAVLLAVAWLASLRPVTCPSDPELARVCERAKHWNRRILILASVMWAMGFMAAYLALPVARWLDSMR